MEMFQLMSSDHFHVVLHPDKEHGLLFNRLDGTMTTINHDDAKELSNLKIIGAFYGIIGHYLGKYLVLIKDRSHVGSLYEPRSKTNHDIYVITQVQVIDVSATTNNSTSVECSQIDSVRYDATSFGNESNQINMTTLNGGSGDQTNGDPLDGQDFASLPITINSSSYTSRGSTQWNPFKLANSIKPIVQKQFLRTVPKATKSSINDKDVKNSSQASTSANGQLDESDKRLVEEMVKLFNNTKSFYYSPTLDLTNRFSRRNLTRSSPIEAVWKTADERFFWNKYMLKDLIELSEKDEEANCFICVILQGFVAIENRTVPGGIERGEPATSENALKITSGNINCDNESELDKYIHITGSLIYKEYQLALISRRSVFQAGTRYRRRGCDDDGNSANFVETEQIIRCNQHVKSLIILRGSIPLYWYQTGYNYRPPPVLVRTDEENTKVFSKHFEKLIDSYGTKRIISVDCTEQTGREKALHNAYKIYMDKLVQDHPLLELIEFDFHKYCRGRQCTDAQIEKHLISCGLSDQMMKEMKYYWNDGDTVLVQDAVFRVNCLDCSDRTNVVQRAIALKILDLQLARLGVIAPDTNPEYNDCRRIMQNLWSINGNVLSTQYCGTRALFGGDRKLAGYLKDTYSSASRYYISKFRDSYRQAAIDAMLGVESIEGGNQSMKNHYDIMNFDPLLAGRTGGALLKDVGNRVTNRLARLRGKLNVNPFIMDNISPSSSATNNRLGGDEPEMVGDTLDETFDQLNIDWPSSESVENETNRPNDLFAKYTNVDDCYQDDDEYSQLMLSIDVAELQRLREPSGIPSSNTTKTESNCNDKPEEINMTEARNPTKTTITTKSSPSVETSTTST